MQAAGKAWKAIKTGGAKTWKEWTEVIGPGLVKARAEAQSISNASSGKGYNAAMGALPEEYGFGTISDGPMPSARCTISVGAQPDRRARLRGVSFQSWRF